MLKDKDGLVTGASSGIGRAIAVAYAREGASVIVSDVDIGGGEKTVAITGSCHAVDGGFLAR